MTALFDLERQMSIDLAPFSSSSSSSNTAPTNGTNVEILTETQLFNHAVSSASTSTVEKTAATTTFVSDVPQPTANGGYSHTTSSKAKISAANKGKTPWNKGRQRSPEERARIAAGVRAKNRERFLKKLVDMGLTEEEYEAQKREQRRQRDAERRARRTEKGGYRPTEETKQKISKILKKKYANGEIQRKRVDPSKVRRGFVHSEETRRKISESLKKRWADDEGYRENMKIKTRAANTRDEVRKQISETLKQKWKDPEFRSEMMEKIANRNTNRANLGISHREKISEAMKKRWQDSEYRNKVVSSMKKRSEELAKLKPPSKPKMPRTRAPKKKPIQKVAPKKTAPTSGNFVSDKDEHLFSGGSALKTIQPVAPKAVLPRSSAAGVAQPMKTISPNKKNTTPAPKRKQSKPKAKSDNKPKKKKAVEEPLGEAKNDADKPAKKSTRKSSKDEKGSVTRLREERRDLYDLLYGDDDDEGGNQSKLASAFEFGDENLDSFDPYGLEDF